MLRMFFCVAMLFSLSMALKPQDAYAMQGVVVTTTGTGTTKAAAEANANQNEVPKIIAVTQAYEAAHPGWTLQWSNPTIVNAVQDPQTGTWTATVQSEGMPIPD